VQPISTSILFNTHAWSTSKLTYTLFGILFRKTFLLFAMFTRMINLQTCLPNHSPSSAQIFSSTRSVSPMGTRSCGGVSRKITLPPHVSYYCRIHDSIKEDYTANSRELLLHDQLMQWQDSWQKKSIITASYNQGLVDVKLGSVSYILTITIARIRDQLESRIRFLFFPL
jgi:hypothetical protein